MFRKIILFRKEILFFTQNLTKPNNMNVVKNLLIALALIIVIASIGIYFLPSNYELTNSIVINRPASLVYSQVADFSKWSTWSPWKEKEPTAKITVEGIPNNQGHKMSWEGEKVGSGNMTLVASADNESIICSDVFVKPIASTVKDYWRFETDSNGTKVTWVTTGGLKYPLGRLFGLAVDKVVGETERHGLENLKKVCEAIEVAPPVTVVDSAVTKVTAIN